MPDSSMAADMDELLEPYAHDQLEYARAFETFLTHTDQKTKTIGWLTDLVNGLRSHGLFVDAGAGDGSMTAALGGLFDRTIAIEPNSALRAELARRCPEAEIVEAPIGEARITSPADFVLCSHVLYYIPQNDWTDTLERLTSWLGAYGTAEWPQKAGEEYQEMATSSLAVFMVWNAGFFDSRATVHRFSSRLLS